MVDRFLVWMGTGVVTAGVTAALVAGAGVAAATDGDSSDGGGTKTSESTNSPGNKDDSANNNSSLDGPNINGGDEEGNDPPGNMPGPGDNANDIGEIGEDETGEDVTGEPTEEDLGDEAIDEDLIDEDNTDANAEAGELDEGTDGTEIQTPSLTDGNQAGRSQIAQLTQAVVDEFGPVAKTPADENVDTKIGATETETVEQHTFVDVTDFAQNLAETTDAPELKSVAFTSPPSTQIGAIATANPLNIVLDIIGTVVFGLYGFVTRLIGGPPILPPNSTVTVYSSRLRIDCGCAPGEGKEVPVDWYIPENPDPDRIIYLQHGFLAAGPWYSYTAATLAEQTNSIVVAPSVTSNFLAYDQCWLGGAPMHQAMAELFDPDNTALADSLGATPYEGELEWTQVVLMGHSAGGGAVSGIARYMTENGDADRLAGVVLLDGVGMSGGKMAEDLSMVPDDIPVYQLAAPRYVWNMFGSGTDALVQARPDAPFYGVTLVNGSHVDTMRGGNFLIQFSQQLVSGFSRPQNVAAAEILMVGWVNDMFAGNQDEGIYLTSGETRTIDTPAGPATLVDLPNSLRRAYLFNFLEPLMAASGGLFTLQPGCLRESTGSAAKCSQSVAA